MDKAHKFDVLQEGDRIPWGNGYATVKRREVVEEIPEDVPEHMHDQAGEPPYVVLEIESPDGKRGVGLAEQVVKHLHVDYRTLDGLNVLAGKYDDDPEGVIEISVSEGGGLELNQVAALRLSKRIRQRESNEGVDVPVAVIGLVVDDLDDFASALDRAVTLSEIFDRVG